MRSLQQLLGYVAAFGRTRGNTSKQPEIVMAPGVVMAQALRLPPAGGTSCTGVSDEHRCPSANTGEEAEIRRLRVATIFSCELYR